MFRESSRNIAVKTEKTRIAETHLRGQGSSDTDYNFLFRMIHSHKEWSLINLRGRCRVHSKSWLDRKRHASRKKHFMYVSQFHLQPSKLSTTRVIKPLSTWHDTQPYKSLYKRNLQMETQRWPTSLGSSALQITDTLQLKCQCECCGNSTQKY